jgi:peptidoglycan/LPS O-acetylase OafA/YrhL
VRFESLDALRGLAAITVALFHSAFYADTPSPFVRHAYLLVDFFFAISGFVIAHAYLDRIRGGRVGYAEFLVLRIGRIYPLHLFVLLLWVPFILAKYLAFASGIGGRDPLEINTAAQFLFQLLLLNSALGADEAVWNYPSWSISAELACYLVFFACAGVAVRGWRGVALLLGAAAACYAFLFGVYGQSFLRMYDMGFLRGLAGFLVGVAIYRAVGGGVMQGASRAARSMLEVLVIMVAVVAVSCAGHGASAQFFALMALFAVVLVFASEQGGWLSAALRMAPFQQLGLWSYSIYLVHAIFMQFSHNAAVYLFGMEETLLPRIEGFRRIVQTDWAPLINVALLLAVIAASALTYRYVEVPCRDRFRVLSRRFAKSSGSAV